MSGLAILTIPVYLHLLGASEWGLVAACVTLQVAANFLDAGFSQIVPRWIAQHSDSPSELSRCIRIFHGFYVGMGLSIFFLLQIGAQRLSSDWFNVAPDQAQKLEYAIRIASVQVAFQFMNNINNGTWIGLRKLSELNARMCFFSTLKHLFAIATIYFIANSVLVYAACFSFVAALEFFCNSREIQKYKNEKSSISLGIHIRPLLTDLSLLSAGLLIGTFVSHLDRFILSGSVEIKEFGIYVVIVTLAAAFQQFNTPITRTYLPILVDDMRNFGKIQVTNLRKMFLATLFFSIFPTIVAIIIAPQILRIWLNDPTVISIGLTPLRLILFAIILSSIYGCIHQVILAAKQSSYSIAFNLLSLFIVSTLVLLWPTTISTELGAMMWIANTLSQLAAGSLWLMASTKKYITTT